MIESAKRQNDKPDHARKPEARGHDRDRSPDNKDAGRQAQKDAALSQPQSPGEPAGGE